MFIRVSSLRVLVAATLLATGTAACASSISSSDARLTGSSATAPATRVGSTLEFSENRLSLAEIPESDDTLALVAEVGFTGTQSPVSLVLEEQAETAASEANTPAAATFLTDAALPLNLADVPEPTAFGLFLIGLAGLLVARRVTRKV